MTRSSKTKLALHGVVLLNKPSGMTSNAAMKKLRWRFNAKKAGHTGSLDPMATGLLPICFGQATKVCEYLLHSSKRYRARVKLGESTDTYDAEGEIIERSDVDVSDQQLADALERFKGEIMQVPPMYSALKRQGQPLYKLARRGERVDRPARKMQVLGLSFTRQRETEIDIDLHCSSGFYVRSLAHDLGEALGCGAHLTRLQRTGIKDIEVEQSIGLDQLLESEFADVVLPIETLIADMPKLNISDEQAKRLGQGQSVHLDYVPEEQGLLRIYRPDNLGVCRLIGKSEQIKFSCWIKKRATKSW